MHPTDADGLQALAHPLTQSQSIQRFVFLQHTQTIHCWTVNIIVYNSYHNAESTFWPPF
jgi:hypothetical protein